MPIRVGILLIFGVMLLTACDAFNTMVDDAGTAAAVEQEGGDNDVAAPAEGVTNSETNTIAYNAPEWTDITLTNARTGEDFTLADFAGKAVFVEPMATWCSNCRAQLRILRDVTPQFSADEAVFVALSVENGLADNVLADYADRNNFDMTFAVVPPELLTQLVEQFGRTVSNPPSMPHFTIAPDGTLSGLSLGRHSAEEIVANVTALIS